MPSTKQSAGDRIGRNMRRLRADTSEIMDKSPASESKAAMKARMAARERVTLGDAPGWVRRDNKVR